MILIYCTHISCENVSTKYQSKILHIFECQFNLPLQFFFVVKTMGNHAATKLNPKDKREKTVCGYCHSTSLDCKPIPKCIIKLICEYYYYATVSFNIYNATTSRVENGTLLKAKAGKEYILRARVFSTKDPLERDVIHEIKFLNAVDDCSYYGVELGITSTDELKWIFERGSDKYC